jgi:hypothetical protein
MGNFMSQIAYLKWAYRWARKVHGPFLSALLALRVAFKPTPF